MLAPASSAPTSLSGTYPYSAYSVRDFQEGSDSLTQNYYFGGRRFPYSTNLTKNPLTLLDLDTTYSVNHETAHPNPVPVNRVFNNQYVPVSPLEPDGFDPTAAGESHAMGEIWCAALWDARARLIAKYATTTGDGNERMLKIVVNGMKLYTPYGGNPTFVQARNGVLQADQNLYAAANKQELWAAFYKRGLGPQASVTSNETLQRSTVLEHFNKADFNLDGQPDIVFQTAGTSLKAWMMNGPTRLSETSLSPAWSGGTWRVAATGDINRDGKMDLFYQDDASVAQFLFHASGKP